MAAHRGPGLYGYVLSQILWGRRAGMGKVGGGRGKSGDCYRCERRPMGETLEMTEKAALKQ